MIGMGWANLGRLIVSVSADATRYNKVMDQVEDRFEKTAANLARAGRRMTLFITAPLAAIQIKSVQAFAEFDKAITETEAVMGKAMHGMRGEIEATARALSQETVFSSNELAKGFVTLARTGATAEVAMGQLRIAAQFAQADAADLNQSIELLTDALGAMGLKTNDPIMALHNMERVGNALAVAAAKAQGSVTDFAQALVSKGGARLRMTNKTLEEGVAILMAYAEQGIKSELAGERMNIMLRDLSRSQSTHAGEWKRLGITILDTNNQMRPTGDILNDLNGLLKGQNQLTQTATLMQLGFQMRSIDATAALLDQGDAINRNTKMLKEAGGEMKRMADVQMQSFSNQMKVLGNRLRLVREEFGEALAPTIKMVSSIIVGLLDNFRALPKPLQQLVAGMTLLVGAMGPAMLIAGQFLFFAKALGPAFSAMTASIAIPVWEALLKVWKALVGTQLSQMAKGTAIALGMIPAVATSATGAVIALTERTNGATASMIRNTAAVRENTIALMERSQASPLGATSPGAGVTGIADLQNDMRTLDSEMAIARNSQTAWNEVIKDSQLAIAQVAMGVSKASEAFAGLLPAGQVSFIRRLETDIVNLTASSKGLGRQIGSVRNVITGVVDDMLQLEQRHQSLFGTTAQGTAAYQALETQYQSLMRTLTPLKAQQVAVNQALAAATVQLDTRTNTALADLVDRIKTGKVELRSLAGELRNITDAQAVTTASLQEQTAASTEHLSIMDQTTGRMNQIRESVTANGQMYIELAQAERQATATMGELVNRLKAQGIAVPKNTAAYQLLREQIKGLRGNMADLLTSNNLLNVEMGVVTDRLRDLTKEASTKKAAEALAAQARQAGLTVTEMERLVAVQATQLSLTKELMTATGDQKKIVRALLDATTAQLAALNATVNVTKNYANAQKGFNGASKTVTMDTNAMNAALVASAAAGSAGTSVFGKLGSAASKLFKPLTALVALFAKIAIPAALVAVTVAIVDWAIGFKSARKALADAVEEQERLNELMNEAAKSQASGQAATLGGIGDPTARKAAIESAVKEEQKAQQILLNQQKKQKKDVADMGGPVPGLSSFLKFLNKDMVGGLADTDAALARSRENLKMLQDMLVETKGKAEGFIDPDLVELQGKMNEELAKMNDEFAVTRAGSNEVAKELIKLDQTINKFLEDAKAAGVDVTEFGVRLDAEKLRLAGLRNIWAAVGQTIKDAMEDQLTKYMALNPLLSEAQKKMVEIGNETAEFAKKVGGMANPAVAEFHKGLVAIAGREVMGKVQKTMQDMQDEIAKMQMKIANPDFEDEDFAFIKAIEDINEAVAAGLLPVDQAAELVEQFRKINEEFREMAKLTKQQEDLKKLLEEIETPAQKFRKEIERIEELARAGLLQGDMLEQARAKIFGDFIEDTKMKDDVERGAVESEEISSTQGLRVVADALSGKGGTTDQQLAVNKMQLEEQKLQKEAQLETNRLLQNGFPVAPLN